MTRNEIRLIVIDTFHELLGTEDIENIDDYTDPNIDLGLDSHDGVEYACFLSRKLGFPFPFNRNPFRDDPDQPYRHVCDIVDLVQEIVSQHEKVNHV